ncbi:XdhC family protein [Pedobacter mendelii]|uniref:Xanthine dehydrogenase subunit A n=1 Tax=Pedobacter mendelii TaxID=1908240 RepID=A0ABQ2BIE9_9SPHI|nr:XdhC/CoxI family protein [Pedobacter mendelii]GGI25404.1 putative xanthine dehydrogenase subunit A [Pedobacter mendelii]
MKEIVDILSAYQKSVTENKKSALATVVKVEGSSYRRPGARMLVTEDGMLTGAISGGCLEGDALRKALSAIHQQENKLVTYDTTDEDDAKFGVQLGCNGIVHILFEPIFEHDKLNPIELLKVANGFRENCVITTLFSLESKNQPGSLMLFRERESMEKTPTEISGVLKNDAFDVLKLKLSRFETYTIDGENFDAFLEFIPPPIQLVIAGAGNDAQPLAEIANILGWEIIVVDGRQTHCNTQRFPNAKKILVAKPDQVLTQIEIDQQTAFVLMTHNYNYDTELLNILIATNAPYIGTLGPKKKLIRMLEELGQSEYLQRVNGPIGLDIGAETAEEIAISIVAEIKTIFSGASAVMLKEKKNPIHFYQLKNN